MGNDMKVTKKSLRRLVFREHTRISIYSLDQPQTHGPAVSASWGLGLQARASTLAGNMTERTVPLWQFRPWVLLCWERCNSPTEGCISLFTLSLRWSRQIAATSCPELTIPNCYMIVTFFSLQPYGLHPLTSGLYYVLSVAPKAPSKHI